jgi:DNA-binding NtrC family response regulator
VKKVENNWYEPWIGLDSYNATPRAGVGSVSTRVVILDSEPIVRKVVTQILQRDGYDVEAVENLEDAKNAVTRFQPDLLVTNLFVRGTTGHDAAVALQGLRPKLRVLFVAGLPDDEQLKGLLSGERCEFFPKPFTAQELTEKVHSVLARD